MDTGHLPRFRDATRRERERERERERGRKEKKKKKDGYEYLGNEDVFKILTRMLILRIYSEKKVGLIIELHFLCKLTARHETQGSRQNNSGN